MSRGSRAEASALALAALGVHSRAVTEPPLQHCLPPVVRPDTHVLLLGSLPGAVSLARAQYYAHPQNLFWRLVGTVIGRELTPLLYDQRLATLLDAGIGLWDTVAAATRKGSLDADIRLHAASDLAALVDTLPALRAVGFNGGTSARIGMPALAGSHAAFLTLPSSSPAYTLPFERKLQAWMALTPFLD